MRSVTDLRTLRAKALYKQDSGMEYRKSHENPILKKVYAEYLGEPGGHRAHQILHCTYVAQKRYRLDGEK